MVSAGGRGCLPGRYGSLDVRYVIIYKHKNLAHPRDGLRMAEDAAKELLHLEQEK